LHPSNSNEKNLKFPNLLADHQASRRGPLVVHGPQVENRWSIQP